MCHCNRKAEKQPSATITCTGSVEDARALSANTGTGDSHLARAVAVERWSAIEAKSRR